MVYLPMCYLYCRRFCADAAADPLLASLREELYTCAYKDVDWDGERHSVSPLDEYDPVTKLMKVRPHTSSSSRTNLHHFIHRKGC